MPVPLLDVNAQNDPLAAALEAAFQRVLRSGQFIMGPEVAAFEADCAPLTGCTHNLGVSSGTDAILLALMALGIGPGDEVIVPAFTFFATAGCVSRVGATPVFADVCPICFNLDPAHAASLITPRTKAMIPVHLFGQMADMDALMALAKSHGLYVIEDAAQAFGASAQGRPAGSFGHFGCYSFFPSKNLGALGDAGLLATSDPALAERARMLRVHGMEPKYCHQGVGGNFRLDTLQAAFLRVKLPHYPSYTAARQANAENYRVALSPLPGLVQADARDCQCLPRQAARLSQSPAASPRLILPVAYPQNEHIWNQYTLRVPGPGQRDALKAHLLGQGIGCEIYYPLSLDQQPCYQNLPQRSDLPVAHLLAQEVLSLPVYPELSRPQQDEVIAAVQRCVAASA